MAFSKIIHSDPLRNEELGAALRRLRRQVRCRKNRRGETVFCPYCPVKEIDCTDCDFRPVIQVWRRVRAEVRRAKEKR